MLRLIRLRLLFGVALVAVAATVAVVLIDGGAEHDSDRAAACVRHRDEGRSEEAERERAEERARETTSRSPLGAVYGGGPKPVEPPCGERAGLPESFADLALANSSRAARDVAPGTQLKPGAYRSALREKAALPVAAGNWAPFGKTPLDTGRTEYDTTNGSTKEGVGGVAGRVSDFATDPATGRLFLSTSSGGVWTSTDKGDSWSSIGESLPTQVVSGLAWTTANGGALLVLTGDKAFGGGTSAGLGAYYTNDLGATWTHASGIDDGLLGFRLAVDPIDPSKVYAATGGGLFRSTDGGRSYVNVNLPTGKGVGAPTPDCTGKPVTAKDCFLANVVTDVVVQGKANSQSAGGKPGSVLAAVGWRAGQKANAGGAQQSPANGLYRSDTGAPGSFTNLDFATNAVPKTDPLTQARIGRIALGAATGDAQDHRVVYAIVQDAVKFNGGVVGLDANEPDVTGAIQSDVFNGVWASTDFGSSWKQLEGSTVIDADLTSGSALAPPVCKVPAVISYCPGVQAWYNLTVAPDPTRQTAAGVPTRLVFGLEELWQMTDTILGLDGTLPQKATVVGRYFAGETCTLLNATNGLPICPAAPSGVPATTTHPDQHAVRWLPDGQAGVTLLSGNDGGVYKQSTTAAGALSNDNWGTGANVGLHTLQPYDAAIAKDGTAYMGMQDNGEGKVEPDGTSYSIFGGDGFFTAVDPDDSKVAYEEYIGGAVSVTKDGGKTWTSIDPTLTAGQFSTPFEMDPVDAKHLVIGGCDVRETTAGPSTVAGAGTGANNWRTVFELGTQAQPGTACPTSPLPIPDPTSTDILNQVSAVDVLSHPAPKNAATGPKTQDLSYQGGAGTIPGAAGAQVGVFAPGTYHDRPFTIGANDGDASVTVAVNWADATNDWDLYLYKRNGSSLDQVDSSAAGDTKQEKVTVLDPAPGEYVVRVVNYTATGTFDAKVTFEQRTSAAQSSAEGSPSFVYVGYCGYCDTITQGTPFGSGIATNVGGDKPGKGGSGDGWHIAAANGLPKRLITSIRMDPTDPRTVYVTLAGYARKWASPGALGEDISKVGTGHVFKSTDAGATFTDISGDLPDTPANWTVLHKDHLVIGTDLGVFESCNADGGAHAILGSGMPNVPISTLQLKPGDPETMLAATFGRGLYSFKFAADPVCPRKAAAAAAAKPAPTGTGPLACAATAGFASVAVTPSGNGLKFAVKRGVDAPYRVDIFRESAGRRVIAERRVASFGNKKTGFRWSGKGRKVGDGVYFVRLGIRKGAVNDIRRLTFTRTKARFKRRPQFYALAACKLLRTARLTRPTFGGTSNAPMRITARLTRPGSISIVVRRGKKVIKRKTFAEAAVRTRSLTVPARRLARGEYRVTITATAGKIRESVKLAGLRL